MHMSGIENLRECIKQRRGELGLTQAEAADRVGMSRNTLQKIEQGKHARPHPRTLAEIDRAMEWKPGTAADLVRDDAPTRLDGSAEFAALVADAVVAKLAARLNCG